ncbi:hypothetical protein ACA910_004383 [Epithemia clementina (nom. ined.)]
MSGNVDLFIIRALEYLAEYESGEFQERLARLESDRGSQDPDGYAEKFFMGEFRQDQWKAQLDEDWKTCLQLLVVMMEDLKNASYHCLYMSSIKDIFTIDKIVRLLRCCLGMQRASVLYNERKPWYSSAHFTWVRDTFETDTEKVNFQTKIWNYSGEPTMNTDLCQLLYDPFWDLRGKYPDLDRWSKPELPPHFETHQIVNQDVVSVHTEFMQPTHDAANGVVDSGVDNWWSRSTSDPTHDATGIGVNGKDDDNDNDDTCSLGTLNTWRSSDDEHGLGQGETRQVLQEGTDSSFQLPNHARNAIGEDATGQGDGQNRELEGRDIITANLNEREIHVILGSCNFETIFVHLRGLRKKAFLQELFHSLGCNDKEVVLYDGGRTGTSSWTLVSYELLRIGVRMFYHMNHDLTSGREHTEAILDWLNEVAQTATGNGRACFRFWVRKKPEENKRSFSEKEWKDEVFVELVQTADLKMPLDWVRRIAHEKIHSARSVS